MGWEGGVRLRRRWGSEMIGGSERGTGVDNVCGRSDCGEGRRSVAQSS